MKRRTAFWVACIGVLSFITTAEGRECGRQFVSAPGFVLQGVVDTGKGTHVFGEDRRSDLWRYYQKRMRRLRWERVADLDAQDRALCGDSGGVYLKAGVSFKVQVCGAEDTGLNRQVSFLFYNLTPEQVLGVYVPAQKESKF